MPQGVYLPTGPAQVGGGAQTVQGGGGGGGPTSYLGPVATGVRVPDQYNNSNKQFMAESYHVATDDIVQLKLVFANWYMSGTYTVGASHTETATGGTASITASINYPIGTTFTQALFGGNATASVASGAQVVSDWITVAIPKGTTFAVREWFSNTAGGIVYTDAPVGPGPPGTLMNFGASGVADQTLGGSISNVSNVGNMPCGILGMTKQGTVAIFGDSRSWGEGDFISTRAQETGNISRSLLADSIGFISTSNAADAAYSFLASTYTNRLALAAYCSHTIIQYGINDLSAAGGNQSATTLEANLATIRGLIGLPAYLPTLEPLPTGETLGNTNRVVHNTNVRAGLAGYLGFFELSNIVETSFNSSVWISGYTADNLHENSTGYTALVTANCIPASAFTR